MSSSLVNGLGGFRDIPPPAHAEFGPMVVASTIPAASKAAILVM
jgi:hypothetical protein